MGPARDWDRLMPIEAEAGTEEPSMGERTGEFWAEMPSEIEWERERG